ncbi:hypothetical protein ACQCT5_03025 [Sutcliffiella halmapala]
MKRVKRVLEIIFGIVIVITILSLEIQLRSIKKSNEKIVELLKDIKNK